MHFYWKRNVSNGPMHFCKRTQCCMIQFPQTFTIKYYSPLEACKICKLLQNLTVDISYSSIFWTLKSYPAESPLTQSRLSGLSLCQIPRKQMISDYANWTSLKLESERTIRGGNNKFRDEEEETRFREETECETEKKMQYLSSRNSLGKYCQCCRLAEKRETILQDIIEPWKSLS